MANHCWNHARITGAKDSLDRIEKAISKAKGEESLWFDTFKKVFDGINIEFSNDTYEEFGSKWFDCNIERESEHDLVISGDSAWSPVSPLFLKLSKCFNVSIESDYEESGCDFGGWFECSNGLVTRDEHTTWLLFCDMNDPGRAFEIIMDNIKDEVYDSYEEWLEEEDDAVVERLTDSQKKQIKDEFKRM